jgi:hypothetical protein
MTNREVKNFSIINTIFTELAQIQWHVHDTIEAIIKHPNLILIHEYFKILLVRKNLKKERHEKNEKEGEIFEEPGWYRGEGFGVKEVMHSC